VSELRGRLRSRLAVTALLLLVSCGRSGPDYQYPDNASLPRDAFIDVGRAIVSLPIRSAARVDLRRNAYGDPLLRWSQVVTPQIALRSVAPGRMVYEITTTYTHPFTIGGNRYRSGTQTTVIDAQTGTRLITLARGTLAGRTMRTP